MVINKTDEFWRRAILVLTAAVLVVVPAADAQGVGSGTALNSEGMAGEGFGAVVASQSGSSINNSNNNTGSSTIINGNSGSQSSRDGEMHHEIVAYKGGEADGYVIPLGPANLVLVVGERGMISCGAFDVAVLDRFGYPAAKMKPTLGPAIADIEDLLAGEVAEANAAAAALGVEVGMSGREALDLL